jgi:hypothetical protein
LKNKFGTYCAALLSTDLSSHEENINENYDLSDYIEKESNEESDDDKFSETDESESHVGNVDTLLDKIDKADLANNT